MLSGNAWIDNEQAELIEAKLLGDRVRLVIQADVREEPEVFMSSYQDGVLLPAIDSKQVSVGIRLEI